MMNEIVGARVQLKLAGEVFRFLYDRSKKEVYNEHFPGIKIDKVDTACGRVIPHDLILKMVEDKAEQFELAMAREQLSKTIKEFKDYSEYF